MGRFAIIDDGQVFDGRSSKLKAMGGAESAIVSLAEALAARGHQVTVSNRCEVPIEHNGVRWRPLNGGMVPPADRYIVNRNPQLLQRVPERERVVFWVHNDAHYLMKLRHALPMLLSGPRSIVLSEYHAGTWPSLLPGGAPCTIPLGVDSVFYRGEEASPPPPRAVFSSHPERGLDKLLDIWTGRIHPAIPHAELHLFTHSAFYGMQNKAACLAEPIIARAAALTDKNVFLHSMLPRPDLAAQYRAMRVMLYWGHEEHAETFSLSMAEAQAAGLPCVARPVGAMPERIQDERTGFLRADEEGFAAAAIALLTQDSLWQTCHRNTIASRPLGWEEAAARFEALHD